MNEKEILRRGMKVRGLTQLDLAKKFGYKTQSSVSNVLNKHKSMRVDVLARMLDILGYDIWVIDKETGEHLGRITTQMKAPKKYKATTPIKEIDIDSLPEVPMFEYGKK